MSLPVEIWNSILDLSETREKLALSTTCSLLHPISNASLWRSIQLYIHAKHTKHKFVKTLAANPALGALVHDLEIWFCYGVDDPAGSCGAAQALLRRLSTLCNLRVLRVTGFLVDAAFCAILAAQWCGLHAITFDRCIVAAAGIPPGALCSPLLTDIRIINAPSMEGWAAIAHPTLRKCVFECDYDIFSWGSAPKYPTFTPPASDLRDLTELVLAGNFAVEITPLLCAARHIRRLTLPRSCCGVEIPPSAFPDLEYIAGDAVLVAPFVRGRPVRAARIVLRRGLGVPVDVLRMLERSTATVTDLELENKGVPPCDFAAMVGYAPATLDALSLTGALPWREDDVVALLFVVLRRQPHLTVISLAKLAWGTITERTALCSLSREFPQLLEARFYYNTRIWRRREGGWTLAPLRRPSYQCGETSKTVVSDLRAGGRGKGLGHTLLSALARVGFAVLSIILALLGA